MLVRAEGVPPNLQVHYNRTLKLGDEGRKKTISKRALNGLQVDTTLWPLMPTILLV